MLSNIIVPIFNFEKRNSQRCYAKNRELLLCNYLRSIIDYLTVLFDFSCSENFLKSSRTMTNLSKCWFNVIKRLCKPLARPRK